MHPMKGIQDISDYFRGLCEKHPALLHSETSGSRVYEVVAYDEAFSDFRTGGREKSYFVRFILPTVSFTDKDGNAYKNYECGLMVGKYYSTRENAKAARMTAWKDAEKVMDEFMSRMVYDSRVNNEIFFNNLDTIEQLSINGDFLDFQGDGSFAAVMYLFNIRTFRTIACGSDFTNVHWTDLQ